MKRPLPDRTSSVKRRKTTAHSELPKPVPARKDVKLKGRARLRLQNKEQSICIEQKNKQIRQLELDIENLQKERHNSNNLLGFVDRFWTQLTSDLELILADLGESKPKDNDGEVSFLSVIASSLEVPNNEGADDGKEVELSKHAEERTSKTKELVQQILTFINQLEDSRRRLWDLIKANDGPKIEVDKSIQQELTKLRAQVDRIRAESAKKHKQCADLRAKFKSKEEQLLNLQQHVVWLEEQNALIATAYKRLIRTNLYQSKNAAKTPQPGPLSPPPPEKLDAETIEENKQVVQTELELLMKQTEEDKISIVRLQNEKVELLSKVDAGLKQYNGKDLEIRVLKSDQAIQEDAFHQTKASHEQTMSILQGSHKTQVEELERRIEEYAKEIAALKAVKSKLRYELQKINVKEMKAMIEELEKRDVDQQAVLGKLREENQQMREQIGNKDLRNKLKECEADIILKDSEIKNLKALINTPDVFERAMYKTEINRLKHRSRRLEGEINELKQNTQAKKLHNLEKKMDILGAEVDRSAKEYQELQKEKETKVLSLLKQIKTLTETNARLKHLNASHNHAVKRLNDEKYALQQSIDSQRVVASKQKSYINSIQEQLSILSTRNTALQTTANTNMHAAQKLRNHLISLTQKYYHMQAEEELHKNSCSKLQVLLEEKESLVTQLQTENRMSSDRYQRTKASLKKVKNSGGGDVILQKQLEISRKRLLCNLCGIRRKSRIITKCLHMFCDTCINKHFASRNRKCPQCKHAFGKSDIKDVSFNFTS